MCDEKFGVIEENISAVLEISELVRKTFNRSKDAPPTLTYSLPPGGNVTDVGPSKILAYYLIFRPLNAGEPHVLFSILPQPKMGLLSIFRFGGEGWKRDMECTTYTISSKDWTIKKALKNWVSDQPTTIDWVAYFNQGSEEGES